MYLLSARAGVTFGRAADAQEEKPAFAIARPSSPRASDRGGGGCGGPGPDARSGAAGGHHGRPDRPDAGGGQAFRSGGPSPDPAALGSAATRLRRSGGWSVLGRPVVVVERRSRLAGHELRSGRRPVRPREL